MIGRRIVKHFSRQKSSSCFSALGHSRGMVTTGVIFDMDGTLTHEDAIDFQAMYDRIGFEKRGDDIISQVKEDIHPEFQAQAFDIIREEEMLGCNRMILKPDLNHCIEFLKQRDIRMAISTRNCREAYEIFAERANFHPGTFAPVIHRESLNGINKPDPRVAQYILQLWGGYSPGGVWFVGDSMDDIRCGKGAGCRTCLITSSPDRGLQEDHLIDARVTTLKEFLEHITVEN